MSISSIIMVLHLDSLILPQRLQAINALELKWGHCLADPSEPISSGCRKRWSQFGTLCARIPTTFLGLWKLWFSMAGNTTQKPARIEINRGYLSPLCASLDPMCVALGARLKECHIVLPQSLYYLLKHQALGPNYVRLAGDCMRRSTAEFWRQISPEDRSCADHKPGHWIHKGDADIPAYLFRQYVACGDT